MVVVVDDHADTAELLARLLRRHGHEAAIFTRPRDAIEFLKTCKPRVVILDVMMPEMNGPEVLAAIRADPSLHDLPVLMYSADFTQERMKEAARLGAQEYLVKGVATFHHILQSVEKYDQHT